MHYSLLVARAKILKVESSKNPSLLGGFHRTCTYEGATYEASTHPSDSSIELVSRDKHKEESVIKAALTVIGDLVDTLGSNMKILFKNCTFCEEFLGECLESVDE